MSFGTFAGERALVQLSPPALAERGVRRRHGEFRPVQPEVPALECGEVQAPQSRLRTSSFVSLRARLLLENLWD